MQVAIEGETTMPAGTTQQQNPRINPEAFSSTVGVALDTAHMGVIGTNAANGAFGFLAGNDLVFNQHAGVYGESDQAGVFGSSDSDTGTGVFGRSGGAQGFGVRGEAITGVGVQGTSFGSGLAGKFNGNVTVTGLLEGGSLNCSGDIEGNKITAHDNLFAFDVILSGGDCAEDFDIAGLEAIDPGTVMVMGQEGVLSPCEAAYDKKVTGVISGAGDYRPGIVLDKRHSAAHRLPVALVGKVYCKVDAQFGSVDVGDLLTTSATVGHAMKASDHAQAFGAVLGKALRPISSGRGLIPVLVALQ
jgi:hypothetical protein